MELLMQVGAVAAGLVGLWALYGITVSAIGAARRRSPDDERLRALYGQNSTRR